jgi:DNA-binding MarR family transcriptional regulator
MAVIDNRPMARKQARPDTTPAGNLSEVQLKPIIGYQLAQATVATSRIYDAAVGRKSGLHRLEYTIVMLVRENPGCTASSLAKALDISTPNIALWLERVIGKGLVDRTQSAADRRSNHLHLTVQGERAAAEATQAIQKGQEAALSLLSAAERAILAELLHKVAACRNAIDGA